jgi:hypothetical protein
MRVQRMPGLQSGSLYLISWPVIFASGLTS